MTQQNLLKTFIAGGAIAGRRLVEFNATGDKVTQANSNIDNIIGVADTLTYKTGERIDVGIIGIFDVEAGGAISAGAFITSDANGKAVAAVADNSIAGQAMEKADASGDIITIKNPNW